MIDNWRQTLIDSGAVFSQNGVTQHFITTPFPNTANLCITDLSGLVSYDLVGADAHKFLQGQITQDAKLLERMTGFLADHCTPKGRILGTLIALPLGPNSIRLVLPKDNAEALIGNLKKYLVFSKATILVNVDNQLLLVSDKTANALLAKFFPALPEYNWQTAVSSDELITKICDNHYLINVKTTNAIALITETPAQFGGWRYWQQFLIEQGIAWVDSSNSEQFTPHQVNHQFIDAISFKKGCYTGQEVVARMHYKATAKSHLYGYTLQSTTAPDIGCAIESDDHEAGKVLWVAQTGPEFWVILAEIKIALAESNLYLGTKSSEKLRRFDLPYAINK